MMNYLNTSEPATYIITKEMKQNEYESGRTMNQRYQTNLTRKEKVNNKVKCKK